jgi:hypothetical protein
MGKFMLLYGVMYQFLLCFLFVNMPDIYAYLLFNYLLLSRTKGQGKGEIIQQPSEHLRHGNSNCSAPFVTNCILRRIASLNHG